MKKYQITDPKFFSNHPSKFIAILTRSYLRHKPDFIVFRGKETPYREKRRILKALQKIEKKVKSKIIINKEHRLAKEFGFGVHLTSTQFGEIEKLKRAKLFVVVSTHTTKELEFAIKKRADLGTFSPIFATPNKGKPKGENSLNQIHDKIKKRVVALGGIVSLKEVALLKEKKIYGFASIRYFVDFKG